jgi:hypothetical protein
MIKLFDFFPQALQEEVVEYHISKNKQKNINRLDKSTKQPIEFAYKRLRKLPLMSKNNVLSAFNYFDKVAGVSEEEQQEAFSKIIKAAESFELCTIEFKDRNSKYNNIGKG